jgi:spore coat polysaccharide biosynthesis protein SpsF
VRRLVAALACRAGGSRLYGKPLHNLDLERRLTVLEYQIEFLRTQPEIEAIVLGVAEGPENEPFHAIARKQGLASIRGDEVDVLMRLIQCGEAGGGTDVFRITTESPFIYFEPIPAAWQAHVAHGNDVTSVSGVPDGPGFEMITLETLRRSHHLGDSRHRSELVTLYVREHQDDFRVETLEASPEVNRMDIRLTIDYPEDLVVCRRIYEHFKALAPRIPLARIVEFWDASPELAALVKPYVAWERWYR